MKNLLWLFFLLPIFSLAQQQTSSQEFWAQLKTHCGKAYEGWIIHGAVPKDGFTGEKLVMHVRSCDGNDIRIPFFVGEDKSRTWLLHMNRDKIISLKHDHRLPDGTAEDLTNYGGTNSNVGLKDLQMFPADVHTATILPAAANNIWWFTINEKSFTYNLRRVGSERLFSISFDLTTPVENPGVPWGTQN